METILVIGSGTAPYRQYSLSAMASRYALVLVQEDAITWQAPYIVDSERAAMADPGAVAAAAGRLADRHRIAGILTYEEPSVELTAAAAAELGLPCISLETARLCRDKHLMRKALAAHGVPSAASVLVSSLAEAGTAAARIGYPVVLKPRQMASSMGVIRVDSAAGLTAAWPVAAGAAHPRFAGSSGVLVEEFLDGDEFSAESVVTGGEVQTVAITRKQVGFAPFFEELGHIVSAREPVPGHGAALELVRAAHRALGVQMGVTHAEFKLTSRGPRMVELGARLGGDLIPYLVRLATGVDLSLAAADAATGQRPDLTPKRRAAAAIRFLYPAHDVTVRQIKVDPQVSELAWADKAVLTAQPGDICRVPPGGYSHRLGFLIVTGADLAETQSRLDELQALVQLDLEPAPPE